MIRRGGGIDAAGIRMAVESAASTLSKGVKQMSRNFLQSQIQSELQKQGASPGTAREAAKFAADMYERGSGMGSADLKTALKSAGEFAERNERGFKFKMPGKR